MKNKKGFVGGLISIIITVAIILGMYIWWQKMTVKNLQDTTKKAAQDAGVEINTQDASPQGQVNAVRDVVGKIQDKENAEIENEMKK
jgi:cytoskeletal protein RodZ